MSPSLSVSPSLRLPSPHRPCKRPGCAGFTAPGSRYCAAHQQHARAEQAATRAILDEHRGTAHERGYDAAWAKLSRLCRFRFPMSAGYLTRTALWTPNLAHQFHALRLAAAERLQYAAFFAPGGPALRWIEQFPIYDWHPSAHLEPAEVTDHIIPHRGDPTLFWGEWNLQTLSKSQHDTKTATVDGGFRGAKH
jgi:5-methylcytosine-specific restriction endonuclease McrA